MKIKCIACGKKFEITTHNGIPDYFKCEKCRKKEQNKRKKKLI